MFLMMICQCEVIYCNNKKLYGNLFFLYRVIIGIATVYALVEDDLTPL